MQSVSVQRVRIADTVVAALAVERSGIHRMLLEEAYMLEAALAAVVALTEVCLASRQLLFSSSCASEGRRR